MKEQSPTCNETKSVSTSEDMYEAYEKNRGDEIVVNRLLDRLCDDGELLTSLSGIITNELFLDARLLLFDWIKSLVCFTESVYFNFVNIRLGVTSEQQRCMYINWVQLNGVRAIDDLTFGFNTYLRFVLFHVSRARAVSFQTHVGVL
jgi:hypothetical protein